MECIASLSQKAKQSKKPGLVETATQIKKTNKKHLPQKPEGLNKIPGYYYLVEGENCLLQIVL